MTLEEKNIPDGAASDVSPEMKTTIEGHVKDGFLPCPQVYIIAKKMNMTPANVGAEADKLGIRLSRCQLGLFGYPGRQGWKGAGVTEMPVPDGLEDTIKQAAKDENQIGCKTAWNLARKFRISRMQMGWVIETTGVRIANCQIGAF